MKFTKNQRIALLSIAATLLVGFWSYSNSIRTDVNGDDNFTVTGSDAQVVVNKNVGIEISGKGNTVINPTVTTNHVDVNTLTKFIIGVKTWESTPDGRYRFLIPIKNDGVFPIPKMSVTVKSYVDQLKSVGGRSIGLVNFVGSDSQSPQNPYQFTASNITPGDYIVWISFKEKPLRDPDVLIEP